MSSAAADERQPAVIKMPRDTPQATSGQDYAGVFEVHIFEEGALADFKLEGKGWTVLSFDPPTEKGFTQVGKLRIPFQAVPHDADQPIRLSFTYDGQRVSKPYELGPKYFGRFDKSRAVHSAGVRVEEELTLSSPQDADQAQASPSGGAVPLQFSGRFVYTRPDGEVVGADHIWFEVMDDDGLASDPLVDETIWSFHTDANGNFNSPIIWWDDCDVVGCDEPDIYIRFECDTSVGQVQDPGVMEEDWFWWTMNNIREDFTGESINFGTMSPPADEMPAVHIWNALVRGHRYIGNITGINVDHVDIQWPETGVSSRFSPDFDEIYMVADQQWSEATVMHEYGHHFIYNHSTYTPSDYCNDDHGDTPFCDYASGVPGCYASDVEKCTHCGWCRETDHDAWNEGWPNWLGDVVTRSYEQDYEFEDCTPYTAYGPDSLEGIGTCCQDSMEHDPFLTEGFPGSLLRDIEDEMDDKHDPDDNDNHRGDLTTDCLALGPDEIFTIVTQDQPTTPAQFLSSFRARYPQHTPGLWQTARNVHPSYVSGFPADTDPPGLVTGFSSPTHPSGVGGALPCISVAFDQPADDVTGAKGFSADFTTNPGGNVPIEDVNYPGPCVTQVTSGPKGFGNYYVSIRAVDYDDHWGPVETFGPLVVNGDCNSNGIIDLCDIECDARAHAQAVGLQCTVYESFCDVTGCGLSEDCNLNAVPDDCDLASGTSKDCDRNGVPDECDGKAGILINWADGDGSWHVPANWYKESECPDPPQPPVCDYTFPVNCSALPVTPDNVCIDNAFANITVDYTSGVTDIDVLACYESLSISGGAQATLKVNEPSWVDGDLDLTGNNSILEVVDSLDIGGLFTWTGSNVTSSARLKGAGITYASGGVHISEIVHLDQHHLILDGNSTSVSTTGRVDFISPSIFEIWPGSTYEHQGSTGLFRGWFDDMFVNGGTLIKSVDTGASSIYMFTSNAGLIHVKTGTLKFYLGGSHTGDFLAEPGAVLDFAGARHEFLSSSSIVAETVEFTPGVSGNNTIRGTYNVSGSSRFIGGNRTDFTHNANVVNYGPDLILNPADVRLDAVFGDPINFNSIAVRGVLYVNSGDPINVTTLTTGGTIRGPSEITVSGLLTWNGGGHFRGPGVVNADGPMVVGSGGSEKTLYKRVFNNASTATLLGGFTLGTEVVFNNLDTGVIDIQFDGGAISGIYQTLDNAGAIVKSAGTGTSTISAPTTNTGTVEVQTGVLEFYTHYNGHYIQTAGQTLLNGGDINMFGREPLEISGGLLAGTGIITGNVLNAAGTATPGLSAGQINIVGNYTQHAAATYKVELGGAAAGQFDLLTCTGHASLAGDLEVTLINNFVPAECDAFPVLTAGSISGQFENVNVTNLPPGMELRMIPSPTAVTLLVAQAPSDGDCDGDCDRDGADVTQFATCMTGPGGPLGLNCECADLDNDSDVDLRDSAHLQARYTGPIY